MPGSAGRRSSVVIRCLVPSESRLAARAAVTVMLVPAATWMVPGPTVTATVLRARAVSHAGQAGHICLARPKALSRRPAGLLAPPQVRQHAWCVRLVRQALAQDPAYRSA